MPQPPSAASETSTVTPARASGGASSAAMMASVTSSTIFWRFWTLRTPGGTITWANGMAETFFERWVGCDEYTALYNFVASCHICTPGYGLRRSPQGFRGPVGNYRCLMATIGATRLE